VIRNIDVRGKLRSMAQERDYRELLQRAQESVEPIRHFINAAKKAPVPPDAKFAVLISAAENHANALEHELDELWDLLKRAL
jgi:hypothetical protein